MEVNDFGIASFKYTKKDFKGGFTGYGYIRTIEDNFILFEDNDGYLYIVKKNEFEFERKEIK